MRWRVLFRNDHQACWMEAEIMDGWILSLIICLAPQPGGADCSAYVLRYGLTESACRAELLHWSRHSSRPRLECMHDPALTAELREEDGEEIGEDAPAGDLAST